MLIIICPLVPLTAWREASFLFDTSTQKIGFTQRRKEAKNTIHKKNLLSPLFVLAALREAA
ncbi:MAG: hypothetical protein FDX18_02055 [Chlorobium sp.]|nr:MAG: hypothetical protein FDX18_02055 [Chlorobium sp.]